MRKKTAFLTILIANIVLLVLAVVPHHHHHEQVCIEVSHCQDDDKAHQNSSTQHNHQHDWSDNCFLKQTLTVPVQSPRYDFKCLVCNDNPDTASNFQAILADKDPLLFVPGLVLDAKKAFPSRQFGLIHSSCGLRAPPIV
jgi:hypothetical protein